MHDLGLPTTRHLGQPALFEHGPISGMERGAPALASRAGNGLRAHSDSETVPMLAMLLRWRAPVRGADGG
jgi:hypothetical protein